jgi:hypothetical protein
MRDDDPHNKKMDHVCFLKKRTGKLQHQALKSGRECEEREIRLVLHKAMLVGHSRLSMEEKAIVDCNVELHLKRIRDRITDICGQPPIYMSSQAHTPTPNFANDMASIGSPMMFQAKTLTPYISNVMGATGAHTVYHNQTPTPYATGSLEIVGSPTMHQAQAPPQQHEKWLELMRTGGGDLGTTICSASNGGATLSSTTGINSNDMLQPFNLGARFNYPWGGGDPGPSSSAFPPM